MKTEDRLASLKQKYQTVLSVIEQQQVRLENVHVQGDKLLIKGVAPSQEAKNRVWDQIKLLSSYEDLICDITVAEGARTQGAGVGGGGSETYTVKSGDTLSKISKQFYGDANQYMKIFNANKR